jgi:hypothetical protein
MNTDLLATIVCAISFVAAAIGWLRTLTGAARQTGPLSRPR